MNTITEKTLKLIIFFLIFQSDLFAKDIFKLENNNHQSVQLRLAITPQEQRQGLSELRSTEFKITEGMLFINTIESPRTFWMNNTYFNLDIIFLDKNLKIVGIEKNAPAHPGTNQIPKIYVTQTFQAQYVLETKSNSPFSKSLKINDQLKFSGKTTLSEIVLKIHQQQ